MSVSCATPSLAPSDGELIVRVGRGDHAAFESLYARFAQPVLRLALRRLGDRGRAEDAVQDIFAKVWRGAATYRPERGAGGAWVYGIAKNVIVDSSRARRDPVAEPVEVASDEPGPADRAESDWVSERLQRALAVLPSEHRELIHLAYWSGLTQAEIAANLGVPLGTVKTRTRRALMRLSDLLESDDLR